MEVFHRKECHCLEWNVIAWKGMSLLRKDCHWLDRNVIALKGMSFGKEGII